MIIRVRGDAKRQPFLATPTRLLRLPVQSPARGLTDTVVVPFNTVHNPSQATIGHLSKTGVIQNYPYLLKARIKWGRQLGAMSVCAKGWHLHQRG